MPTATVKSEVLVFEDASSTNPNPLLRYVDWRRTQVGVVLDEVRSERVVLRPGTSWSATADTSYYFSSLSLCQAVPGKSAWFQFRLTATTFSAFVSPGAVVAQSYVVTAQPNGSIVVSTVAASWAALRPGYVVYLAGSNYGDTGPWSSSNQGFWKVVSVTSTDLTLARVFSEDPVGVTETVSAAATTDVQYYSPASALKYAYFADPSGTDAAVFNGVKSVLALTQGWFVVAAEAAFFPQVSPALQLWVVDFFYEFVRVESDQPVEVSLGNVVGGGSPVEQKVRLVVPPLADSLATSLAALEVFGFSPSLAVRNWTATDATVSVVYCIRE